MLRTLEMFYFARQSRQYASGLACRLALSFWPVLVIAIARPPVATSAPIPDQLPIPVHSRQNLFSIPFQYDGQNGGGAVQVQLQVSENRGGRWLQYAQSDPSQGRFTFRARRDGEYWFSVRTLDSRSPAPGPPATPELIVIVDTAPPQLALSASRGQAGEITARWQIVEPNLDAASLRLEYRPADGSQPWQQVAIRPEAAADRASQHDGRAVWLDPGLTDGIRVRMQAQDLAGNPVISETLAEPAGVPSQESEQWVERPLNESRRRDGSPEPYSVESTHWPVDETAKVPLDERHPAHATVQQPPDLPDAFPGDGSWSPNSPETAPSRGARVPAPASDSGADANGPRANDYGRQSTLDPFAENGFGAGTSAALAAPERSPIYPPVGNQRNPSVDAESEYTIENLPAGERLRLIGSRRFAIDYSLERQPGEGPLLVDVWMTRDGGLTWALHATDDDGKSPATVQVDQEGLYGFRLSSRELADSQAFDPPSGERPSIWIGVDRTRPDARLLRADPSPGDGPTSIEFAWESRDVRLSEQGAALYFSAGAGQPWTLIARELPPSGSYSWQLPAQIAPRMYVRLEVRDEAGNLATADWPNPISIRPPRQPVKIRGITPQGGTSQGARSQRRYFR